MSFIRALVPEYPSYRSAKYIFRLIQWVKA